ncbi:MAG: hypothetical protein Q8R01_11685 [Ramlibacter sp.]|nr:hypothetical protein [Ramlibacter sp.]
MAPDKDKPGKDRHRKAARDEYEVAYYTKELGRPLQRKMLQKRFDDFSDNTISAASHGEEPSPEGGTPLPPEDRAG